MIVPVADFDFPPDLIDLQRRFDAADLRCEEVAATLPAGVDVAAGTASVSEEQQAELRDARAVRLELAQALQAHEWWTTVDNVFEAKQALRRVSRG